MAKSDIGYFKNLFVLPFDHRGSFETGLLNIKGRMPTGEERERLAGYKRIIYNGFLKALDNGVPKGTAAILVDQGYGEALIADAGERGITTCVPVEKSGQAKFDFEYGSDFEARLKDASPTFAKALVRYNPEDDRASNEAQRGRLKVLSDHAHADGYRFMFELLVPATESQLRSVEQDTRAYDLRLRSGLTIRAIGELQESGIEPDVWKIEGAEDPDSVRAAVAQARADGRDSVGVIILGRGESEARVRDWITVGARVEGVIGFAVGRTVFWQPLVEHRDGLITRDQASDRIAGAFQGLYELFVNARGRR